VEAEVSAAGVLTARSEIVAVPMSDRFET